jgi:cysteine synthase
VVEREEEPAESAPVLRGRPTPLLLVGSVLVKLESLRPGQGADDRALPIWDVLAASLQPGLTVVAAGTSGSALAGAAWAHARGTRLEAVIHGAITHETRETLRLWGATFEQAGTRQEAIERARTRAAESGGFLFPPLDGAAAAVAQQASLGTELLRELQASGLSASLLVAPAGARAALLGCFAALRSRRGVELHGRAVVAASLADELPELPAAAELPPEIELVPVTRAHAAAARARMARDHGLSVSHASAAAIACAESLAGGAQGEVIALATAAGEREFSLDAPAGAG